MHQWLSIVFYRENKLDGNLGALQEFVNKKNLIMPPLGCKLKLCIEDDSELYTAIYVCLFHHLNNHVLDLQLCTIYKGVLLLLDCNPGPFLIFGNPVCFTDIQ